MLEKQNDTKQQGPIDGSNDGAECRNRTVNDEA